MHSKTSIVIIGAGSAGVQIAQTLDTKLDPSKHTLTIVSESDYYRHLPGSLRPVVTAEGELEQQVTIPFDRLFGKGMDNGKGRVGSVLVGKVVGIEEEAGGQGGHILFEDSSKLKWDYLVITTGSKWASPLNWPLRREEVPKFVGEWREKFASARSILLAGAGSVGAELAGEILDFHPGTKVTVVHRGKLPLNTTYPDAFRKRIEDGLVSRGAEVITNDTVPELPAVTSVVPGRTIKTSNGVTIPAELIVPTGGPLGVNTSFISASTESAPTISKSLASDGHLKVEQTLQLSTNPRVFAAGDVVAIEEQHSIIKIISHIPVVISNLLALLQADEGKALGTMKKYTGTYDMILITNGQHRGAAWLFHICGYPVMMGDWLASKIKSKTLMVEKARKILNY